MRLTSVVADAPVTYEDSPSRNGAREARFPKGNLKLGRRVDDEAKELGIPAQQLGLRFFLSEIIRQNRSACGVHHGNDFWRRLMTPSIVSGALGTVVISVTRRFRASEPIADSERFVSACENRLPGVSLSPCMDP